jgi:hypothetical protein
VCSWDLQLWGIDRGIPKILLLVNLKGLMLLPKEFSQNKGSHQTPWCSWEPQQDFSGPRSSSWIPLQSQWAIKIPWTAWALCPWAQFPRVSPLIPQRPPRGRYLPASLGGPHLLLEISVQSCQVAFKGKTSASSKSPCVNQ